MYNNILNYIYDRIYVNGRGEIDPIKLREVFQECLYTLGGNANFMGVASTAGPIEITPDSKQVYIALPSNVDQVYSGFGEEEGTSFTLPAGCLGLFYYAANQWNHITLETPNYKEIPFISGRNSYRTLTQDEWAYLLETRGASTVEGTSNARYVKAKVNDVNGLIIFPDYYTKPSEISITNINTGNAAFEDNTYTLEEWEILENSGVVFLPCSGSRLEYETTNINISGFYWSSTKHLDNVISGVIINSTMVSSGGAFGPDYGYAVRLVNESKSGFSIALNKSVGITKGNLQYKADTDDWRFAPEAWQCIGLENSHIRENYSGWIDLFGYGTSGWNNGATCYQPWSSSVTSTDYLNESLTGNYDRSDWGIWISRKIHTDELPVGVPNGVAGLDANGQVPSSQLPSYVDDVIEGYLYNNHFYTDQEHTTLVDEDQAEGKIYIDLSDDKTYRWSGSVYVEISKSLVLGTTHTTAFYGDYGQTAYNHATDANRNITAKSKKLYKISVTSEGHVGQVEESTVEEDIEALQDNVEDLNNGLFPGDWRTPTYDELNYILNTRTASTIGDSIVNARYAKAKVGDRNGLILFPDVFTLPSGITINNVNVSGAAFNGNSLTTDQWTALENNGCVFLPVGGRRVNSVTPQDTNSKANYWTSSQVSSIVGRSLHFYDGSMSLAAEGKYMGQSVRLVKSNNDSGAFSFSASTKGDFAKSNLQFHCKNKVWRFAENAYDVIAGYNVNIAEDYDGWVDLFGWGTSGWNSGAVCYQPWSVSTNGNDYLAHDLTGDYKKADWGVLAMKKQLQEVAFSGSYNDLGDLPLPTVYSEATITWDVTNVRNVITLVESVPYDKAMLSVRITDVSAMQRGQIITLYINGEYRNISTPRPDGSSNSLNTCYTNNNDVLTLYYDANILILLDRRNYIDTNFVYFTNNNQSSDTYKFLCPNGITSERLMSKEYIGKVVYVYFTNTNTAQNPEFLIEFDNTASASHKPIKYKGTVITTDNLDKAGKAGCIACYVYDGNYWNWLFDTSSGALEFASTAEAIDGTETEKVMSPATNRAAHDARHWFGTRAEFETLEQGGLLSEDVIYHVEEVQGENNEIVIVSMIGTSDLSTMTLTVTSSTNTPAEIETLVGSGKTVICKFGDGVDPSGDIYMNYVGSLTFGTAAMGVNVYISYRNNSWSGKIVDIVNRVPEPTTQDEGKLLSVNANGEYELVTIVNAENVPY